MIMRKLGMWTWIALDDDVVVLFIIIIIIHRKRSLTIQWLLYWKKRIYRYNFAKETLYIWKRKKSTDIYFFVVFLYIFFSSLLSFLSSFFLFLAYIICLEFLNEILKKEGVLKFFVYTKSLICRTRIEQ